MRLLRLSQSRSTIVYKKKTQRCASLQYNIGFKKKLVSATHNLILLLVRLLRSSQGQTKRKKRRTAVRLYDNIR